MLSAAFEDEYKEIPLFPIFEETDEIVKIDLILLKKYESLTSLINVKQFISNVLLKSSLLKDFKVLKLCIPLK